MSNYFDKSLMKFSTDYEDCRTGNKFIGEPVLNLIPKEIENAYFHKYNAKGQLKMKNILDSRENFLNLVNNLKPGSSKTILSEMTC
jgi:acyl-CoA-binding protein